MSDVYNGTLLHGKAGTAATQTENNDNKLSRIDGRAMGK